MIKKFFKNNSLSAALLLFFVVSLSGLALTGFVQYNDNQESHNKSKIGFPQYLGSAHFLEAVFENWESEFLQMWVLVILTIILKQKGASDSKKLIGKEEVDTKSRYSVIRSLNIGKNRSKALWKLIYANSLGIALLCIFLISFIAHGISGAKVQNEEASAHNEKQITTHEYFLSSRFWFESFQNWQSEFLAVGSLLILSIFLRQRGSPESKPIGSSNKKTGE